MMPGTGFRNCVFEAFNSSNGDGVPKPDHSEIYTGFKFRQIPFFKSGALVKYYSNTFLSNQFHNFLLFNYFFRTGLKGSVDLHIRERVVLLSTRLKPADVLYIFPY